MHAERAVNSGGTRRAFSARGVVLPRQHLVDRREVALVQMRNSRQIIIPAADSNIVTGFFRLPGCSELGSHRSAGACSPAG